LIIISQTSTDLPFVLTLRDKHLKSSKIHYVVISRPSNYKILESIIGKNEKITYLNKFGSVNPYHFPILPYKKLNQYFLFSREFGSISNERVYFFVTSDDITGLSLVSFLNKNNSVYNIHFGKVFKHKRVKLKDYKIRDIYYRTVYHFLIRMPLYLETNQRLRLNVNKCKINVIYDYKPDPQVYNEYCIDINKSKIKPKTVLIAESITGIISLSNYQETITKIINMIRKEGYTIFIKGHPHKGHSPFLEDMDVEIIDKSYWPLEFFKEDNLDFIFGINSYSLVYCSRKSPDKTFSLLKLFKYKDSESRKDDMFFLNMHTNYKINFIIRNCDLKKLLNTPSNNR
jgi:hypothetical protein